MITLHFNYSDQWLLVANNLPCLIEELFYRSHMDLIGSIEVFYKDSLVGVTKEGEYCRLEDLALKILNFTKQPQKF